MQSKTAKKLAIGFISVLIAASLITVPALAMPQHSPVTINLCASTGSVTMPDSVNVPIWGFSLDSGSGCGPAQIPGPVLDVNLGDVVTINLTDNVGGVALEIPGQVVSASGSSYSFTASNPGTYLYGSADGRGALMGLYGALIVRPAIPGQAYNSAASAYDVESMLVLSEIDPAFNANPATFNTVYYSPKYWLINGTAYPQTANILADAGDKVLLRYVNAGSIHHTMATLGMHQNVVGRDAYAVTYPYRVVAETIPAGSTLDTIATLPGSAAAGTKFPLYSRQLHLNNGATFPGGMLTYLEVVSGCTNTPPTVSAGSDQTITLPASAALDGTITDDGCATVATTWTKQSGPGTVTFGNANAVDTTASFSTAGVYMLRLTAVDGAFTVYDEVQITVNAPSDLIFQDGFESGNTSAWGSEVDSESDLNVTAAAALNGSSFGLAALIDNTTAMYVQDDTPANEMRYRARFYFDPNSITMANNNAHYIMAARNATTEVLRIEMRRSGGNYQIRANVRGDGGGFANTGWFTISDAPHSIEIDWKASTGPGANNGYLHLWIDNSNSASPTASINNVDNDTRRVESVRLGPLAGIDSGNSGTEFFDAFVSRETTFIGP